MEVIRYKYVFILLTILINCAISKKIINTNKNKSNIVNTTPICPYTKLIEDIFKVHNKPSFTKDFDRVKLFLNSMANVTGTNISERINQEELVNGIIASINRIKNNITVRKDDDDNNINEAIILSIPKQVRNMTIAEDSDAKETKPVGVKSGIEDKIDIKSKNKTLDSTLISDTIKSGTEIVTQQTKFVEILTIEPNNAEKNTTSPHNIIEVLKHLMPMLNNTATRGLHNITIIETNYNKNQSFSTSKNISTLLVTYCDKENFTKANVSFDVRETDLKMLSNETEDYEFMPEINKNHRDSNEIINANLTIGEKRDIMEATEYGMQKMHELYSVLEPKLYSMGLWLDDTNPARYVAAFNAPSEDTARFSRYGYASLQAAAKLKQLTSGGGGQDIEGRNEEPQFPGASALRQSPLHQHCPLKGDPKCPPASKRYRTHDGTCNNMNRPRWGSTMTPVQRFLPPSYSDNLQAPRRSISGGPLPSAREISSLVHEDQNSENSAITHLLMQWGQFIDHDMTSSSQTRGFNGSVPRCCKDGGRDFVPKDFLHPECFPIPVLPSDPFYGPRGVRCLDFVRSSPAPRDDCALGWREQLNQVSAYIDGSPLYASSARQSDKLRLFRNGMLQYGRVQQRRPLLPPERRDELCRGGAVSTDCFKSGDARVNEHPGLVAAHIVWLRQHNRMAQELAHLNPHWSDEKIYQETRKIVGAMIQHITYREFLPIVLGSEVMNLFELEPQKKGFYKGYDPKINASPASSFGSAAFRFGHSLVQPSMVRFDRFHRPMDNNVSLHDEPTNPSNIWSMGAVDRLLLGMVNQPIQKRDEFITEELTNHLFQTPSFNFGMDLAAINIQRGRDHGVPSYTTWREPCGLTIIEKFEDLFRVMPARVVRKLQNLYRHVDDIDLFTGGMAERSVVGGLVGPTFACIIAQQFSNLRKGDRFWYENGGRDSSFTPAQLQQIRRISFAQVLCHTLDTIDNVQPFVFLSSENPDNERISCKNSLLNDFDISPWLEINSDLSNDIRKSDNNDIHSAQTSSTRKSTTKTLSTQKPKRTKPTTAKPRATTKQDDKLSASASNIVIHKKPQAFGSMTINNLTQGLNKTSMTAKHKNNKTTSETTDRVYAKPDVTLTNIDDKLDFKFKSKRYEDDQTDGDMIRHNFDSTKQYSNYDDDDDDVQSVQSVVINNLHQKRPQNHNNYNNNKRPVITVTENVDKYTYLINYVPRPTESWRQTTRRNTDRDVVKVTYQTYDDTYRRPNNPYYYNRHEYEGKYDSYKRNRPNVDIENENFQSSARSNDEMTTSKPRVTIDKIDNFNPTTENLYKLVTFGYVGTYKGDMTNKNDKATHKTDQTDYRTISKDFSTYVSKNIDVTNDDDKVTMKLSTFFHYETATKPFNKQRPTRRNDDEHTTGHTESYNKFVYVKNVLHKFPNTDFTLPEDIDEKKDILRENYNNPGLSYETIEERSSVDKLAFLEEVEQSANPGKLNSKINKPSSPAKTPSVAFQVIPSENNSSHWVVYDENENLPEALPHRMPLVSTDPYALKEIPRPMNLSGVRKRRPGRF